MQHSVHPTLAACAAAVAVEALAHRRHANLDTPAVAFMALALCGGRRLEVGVLLEKDDDPMWADSEYYDNDDNGATSVAAALRFLAVAPVNVSHLTIGESVNLRQWRCVVAALAANHCHGFLRGLDVADNAEVRIDGEAASALLAAASGLAHLRSLRCGGDRDGGMIIATAAASTLRRLSLPRGHAADVDFPALPQLRRLGPVTALRGGLQSVGSIDLSRSLHLRRIDHGFGGGCSLRAVALPPTVKSIGDAFLANAKQLTGLLDLSHLTRLQSIGNAFAQHSSVCEVRLPGSLASIGVFFLGGCKSLSAPLDLSHLLRLRCINNTFACGSTLAAVALPPGVTSIGCFFLERCTAFAAVLDLSRLAQLKSIGAGFAEGSSVADVRLPDGVISIDEREFMQGCSAMSRERIAALLRQRRC
jgi:hypothetical protein